MRRSDIQIEEVLYEDVTIPTSAFGMGEYNNSHYFLLPLFKLRGMILYRNNYVGSYIGDHGRICNIENSLHLLFRFEDFKTSAYDKVTNFFESRPDYKFSYYAGHNENNLVVYVLKASNEDTDCYKTIVNGDYSQVPNWYIDRCSSYPHTIDVKKRIQGICRKEDWHKAEMEKVLNVTLEDSELWSPFEAEREIYRYVKKKEEDIRHGIV